MSAVLLLQGVPLYIFSALLGLVVGSFANVCAYRMPRKKSVVSPPSSCPRCGNRIKAYDNIPVVSYLLLLGKCRNCGERISPIYPLVELANALLYVGAAWKYGATPSLLFYFVFLTALLVITLIDFEFQEIPDELTLPGTALGIIAGWLLLPDPFLRAHSLGIKASLIGAAAGFSIYYLIAVASKGGMGGGDIKMMAMVGAVTGWKGVLLTTFTGSLVGSVAGLYVVVFKGGGRKTKIPFGPFLALGALICILFGQEIAGWYLHRGNI
ncbi:MAG: prepilin peptidase [Actinomycetota bacterium]|nr:prepilin peptidase [Actinomycetota bacterium]